ncbi:MAG: hypothetical protein IJQ02_02430 [Oscillospiraceae bacterium]|nr:hypothetical protein [Oscillospiraceae bacterium]
MMPCLCDKAAVPAGHTAAGFRRRRERRTDPFAQAMMTETAVSAALAVGSRRSRIRLAERALAAGHTTTRNAGGE